MSVPLAEKVRRLKQKQKTWRRRFSRHRADFPLKATSLREDGYAEIRGRCGDIGKGGWAPFLLAVAAGGSLAQFNLPASSQSFAVRAVSIPQRFVHGLEFLGLSPEQESEIGAFCANLEQLD
jgi:hypothetical protein